MLVSWRSPFGAAEDRNNLPGRACVTRMRSWRSPFGAAEDRNCDLGAGVGYPAYWRSPFGAAEDRNLAFERAAAARAALAVALRGGRGSQPRVSSGTA